MLYYAEIEAYSPISIVAKVSSALIKIFQYSDSDREEQGLSNQIDIRIKNLNFMLIMTYKYMKKINEYEDVQYVTTTIDAISDMVNERDDKDADFWIPVKNGIAELKDTITKYPKTSNSTK